LPWLFSGENKFLLYLNFCFTFKLQVSTSNCKRKNSPNPSVNTVAAFGSERAVIRRILLEELVDQL